MAFASVIPCEMRHGDALMGSQLQRVSPLTNRTAAFRYLDLYGLNAAPAEEQCATASKFHTSYASFIACVWDHLKSSHRHFGMRNVTERNKRLIVEIDRHARDGNRAQE